MKLCLLLLLISTSVTAQVNFHGTSEIRYSTWPRMEDTTVMLYSNGLFTFKDMVHHRWYGGPYTAEKDTIILHPSFSNLRMVLYGRERALLSTTELVRIINPTAFSVDSLPHL